jgi:hypothetical protein
MHRRTVAVILVGAWIATLGWLTARRLAPSDLDSSPTSSARLPPGAAFYSVDLGTFQIGTAGVTLDTTALGYRLTEVTTLDLPAGGRVRRDVLRAESSLSRSLRLEATVVTLSEAGSATTLEARAQPDSSLLLRSRRGRTDGDRQDVATPPGGVTVSAAVPFRLAAARRLRPQGGLALASFDPLFLVVRSGPAVVGPDTVFMVSDSAVIDPVTARWIAVAPDSVRVWRVERPSDAGLPMVDWIDASGRLARREYAFGVGITRSPFEVNYTNYQRSLSARRGDSVPDVSGLHRLVDQPRSEGNRQRVRILVARLDGPAWSGAALTFSGVRQRVSGDTVTIDLLSQPGADTTPPPHPRHTADSGGADGSTLQEALANALAGLPPGGDTVAALANWVARGVLYLDTSSAPTGTATVARTRRGTLEDKVGLFVALVDRAGYGARPVFGVDVTRPGLPAHLWAEVWRHGWEAVDPVRGQMPASTTLLRIGEGATIRPLALVPLIGGLRATVLR